MGATTEDTLLHNGHFFDQCPAADDDLAFPVLFGYTDALRRLHTCVSTSDGDVAKSAVGRKPCLVSNSRYLRSSLTAVSERSFAQTIHLQLYIRFSHQKISFFSFRLTLNY